MFLKTGQSNVQEPAEAVTEIKSARATAVRYKMCHCVISANQKFKF